MTWLPIVERELRIRARGQATYWMRFAIAALAAVASAPALAFSGLNEDQALVGRQIFNGLVGAAFLLCCFASLLTADVVSRERREGTLTLLLITDLGSRDILLGKFVSAGLTAFCALAGLLPLLMFPVLVGGVPGREAFLKGLVLLNTMFVALAAGLWASASNSEWSKSVSTTMGIVLPIAFFSFTALVAAVVSPGWYCGIMAIVHGFGWLLLSGARNRMFASLQEKVVPAEISASPAWEFHQTRSHEPIPDDANPIEFCVRRQRGVQTAMWLACLVSFAQLLSLQGYLTFARAGVYSWSWTGSAMSLALTITADLLTAWATTRFFVEMRRSGDLEVLLSTPAGAGTLVTGQWRALRQMIRAPLIASLLPLMFLAASGLASMKLSISRVSGFLTFGDAFLSIVLGLFKGVALCWLGMWFGLKSQRSFAAIARTVGLASGLPYLASLLFLPFMFAANSPGPGPNTGVFILSWLNRILLIGIVAALIFWARRQLQTHLRGIVAVRFGARADLAEVTESFARFGKPATAYS
jgi:hypothetical protein